MHSTRSESGFQSMQQRASARSKGGGMLALGIGDGDCGGGGGGGGVLGNPPVDRSSSDGWIYGGGGGGGGVGGPLQQQRQHLLRLVGHEGAVLSMVLDRKGKRLYSASVDCTIKIWSLIDNSIVSTITGHRSPITHMKLAGKYLYASGGRKVRVWDLETLACIHVIHIDKESGNIRSLEVLEDGRVYVGCQDSTVKAFCIVSEAFIQQQPPSNNHSTSVMLAHLGSLPEHQPAGGGGGGFRVGGDTLNPNPAAEHHPPAAAGGRGGGGEGEAAGDGERTGEGGGEGGGVPASGRGKCN